MVALGGDGSMNLASRLIERGLPRVIGVPKTIDNDLRGTDITFGFETAVATATDALDKLHTTAQSHRRVIVVEVMGRYAGWIALHAGIAGGADVILIRRSRSTSKRCAKDRSALRARPRVRAGGGGRGRRARGRRRVWKGEKGAFKEHALLGGIAEAWRARSPSAPRARRAAWCSAICSAAARRSPLTACWRSASAARRRATWPRATRAAWSPWSAETSG